MTRTEDRKGKGDELKWHKLASGRGSLTERSRPSYDDLCRASQGDPNGITISAPRPRFRGCRCCVIPVAQDPIPQHGLSLQLLSTDRVNGPQTVGRSVTSRACKYLGKEEWQLAPTKGSTNCAIPYNRLSDMPLIPLVLSESLVVSGSVR
jgi:hypothetical protein